MTKEPEMAGAEREGKKQLPIRLRWEFLEDTLNIVVEDR